MAEVLLIDKFFPSNPATARYRYHDLDLTEPRRVEQPAAAALLLRRETIDEIGPLDETVRAGVVRGRRLLPPPGRADRRKCGSCRRRRRGISAAPVSSTSRSARFVDVWYRNMWRYARKWMRPGQAETLRWAIIAGMLLRCLAGDRRLASARRRRGGRRSARTATC